MKTNSWIFVLTAISYPSAGVCGSTFSGMFYGTRDNPPIVSPAPVTNTTDLLQQHRQEQQERLNAVLQALPFQGEHIPTDQIRRLIDEDFTTVALLHETIDFILNNPRGNSLAAAEFALAASFLIAEPHIAQVGAMRAAWIFLVFREHRDHNEQSRSILANHASTAFRRAAELATPSSSIEYSAAENNRLADFWLRKATARRN